MADAPKEPYSVEEPEEPQDTSRGETPAAQDAQSPSDPADMVRLVQGRCPECGAELDPSEDECIRCGFTRDYEKPAKKAPPPKSKEEATGAEHGKPISPLSNAPGFDFYLPMALGSAALLLLIIGHLAGAPGLFPHVRLEDAETVPWATRFVDLLRTFVLLLFWTGCGLAGLFMLSLMFERPLGEARVAALRMGAIMATVRLATFITVPGPRWVEWMTEALLQAAGFVLLSMILFRLAIRNAGILALWTLMTILVLWLFTYAVQWALGG